ncbi:MAG: CDP-diacylglycerol--glycerol-3-phosphate 3-phosphatidyltransferase [Bacillota bacterium]|nr:CDP-diacylglycerol--glycerol-3-phosphate 3-phosphatidyltransferase [Bacillota bacterium]
MNLPNKLTLSRIFLVPVFMLFIIPFPDWMLTSSVLKFIRPELIDINNFIIHNGNYIGAAIFIIAASTDKVDGYLARKNKQVTKFGIFLDPIADKLLITAALLALLQRNMLSGWAAMVIIAREFIVTGLRLIAAGEGIVLAASNWGKIKMVAQTIAVAASLLNNFPISIPFPNFHFDRYAMIVAIIITIYSLFDYLKKNIKVIGIKN